MKNKLDYKKCTLIYILLFIAVFGGAYAGFFLKGNSFITKMDGVDQYYPGFIYFGQYLRNFVKDLFAGHFVLPKFDMSIGMGEDIVGSLNYYGFGDPVYLLAAFAVGKWGPVIYSISFFIRLFGAGLAFMIYCREMGLNPVYSLGGAFCFIINGFTYGGVTSYMGWASVLIYLPLMLTGVERIFKDRKKGELLILLSSVYAGFCGFYFFYMSCVFLVIYCVGRGIAIFGIKNIKTIVLKSLQGAWPVIVGIGLSAPVFFPSVLGFLGSERSDISIFDIIFCRKNWTPYWPVYLSFINQPARYYFKYICKITIVEYLAVVAAFFLPKSKGKIQLCVANTVIALVVALPITGYIFSGFGESGFEVNCRWAFLIHFLFAMTLVYVLSADWGDRLRKIKNTVCLLVVIAAIINTAYYPYKNSTSASGRIDNENVLRNTDSPVVHSEQIMNDSQVFRVSTDRFLTTADRPENTAMYKGYNGIVYWLSIMNNCTQKAVNEFTGLEQEWRSDGFSHVAAFETVMGVKYYLHKGDDAVPEGYKHLADLDYYGETWGIYENENYHGLSYVRDKEMSDQLWADMIENKSADSKAYEAYFEKLLANSARDALLQENYDNKENIYSVSLAANKGDELVVAIPYSKGWCAFVDGIKTEISQKDIMFMAVPISKDKEHTVVLKYKSPGFDIGCKTALFTILLMLAGWLVKARVFGKRKEEEA